MAVVLLWLSLFNVCDFKTYSERILPVFWPLRHIWHERKTGFGFYFVLYEIVLLNKILAFRFIDLDVTLEINKLAGIYVCFCILDAQA